MLIDSHNQHTSEMQQVIYDYVHSVDKEIYDFVNDVIHEREARPVTIGYLSVKQRSLILDELGEKVNFSPRCIMDADTVRHILRRHGKNGKSDHSMADIRDMARMAYVFANFDDVKFEGTYSKKYKCTDGTFAPHIVLRKRIDGTYYIVEAVSDAKSNKSHIVTAFIS